MANGPITFDEARAIGARIVDPDEGCVEELMEHGPDVIAALLDRIAVTESDERALRAIIEGRTTPPTDAEVCAHVAPGRSGWWLVSSPDDMSLELIEQPSERDWCIEWGATQWLPIDLDGRPCAWPVVTEAPSR